MGQHSTLAGQGVHPGVGAAEGGANQPLQGGPSKQADHGHAQGDQEGRVGVFDCEHPFQRLPARRRDAIRNRCNWTVRNVL